MRQIAVGELVDTEFCDPSIVLELLNLAGRIVGIMDWRVEKTGTFGRFTAAMMTEANGWKAPAKATPKKPAKRKRPKAVA